jgi:hypothetical protein
VTGLAAVTQARMPRDDANDKASRRIKPKSGPEKPDAWGYQLEGNSSIMRF